MNWPKTRVRRLFRVVNGGTPTAESENWGGDVPWATPVDLASANGLKISHTERTLTRRGLASGSRSAPAGSLIISTRAPIGYVAECTVPMSFNQGCRALVPRKELDSRFFRYQLGAATEQLNSFGQGSTFVELSSDGLAEVRVVDPPLAEQRAIADYLDTETTRIDALITKKRRLITLLEERYQADVDHLLWRGDTIKLKHVASLLPGYAFSSSDFGPGLGGAKLLRGANVGVGEVDWADSVSLATQGTELARYQVRTGDVILGMDRPFIKAGTRAFVAGSDAEGALLVQRVCRIRPMTVDAAVPIANAIRSPRFAAYIESDLTGVSVPHLSDEQIGEFRVPTISASGNDHLVGHLESARARARAISNRLLAQVDLLVERRQALITAAVTGELAISCAA